MATDLKNWSRREILLALPALAMARRVFGQGGASTLQAHGLSQMTLSVSDVQRSVAFYQALFGMPIQARQGATLVRRIGAGPSYVAITPATGAPSISRMGIAIEDFSVDRVLRTLADHGVTPAPGANGGPSGGPMKVRVRTRGREAGGAAGGTPEVLFSDHDGIVYQLQDVGYCGGGYLGDVCPPV